MMEVLFDTNMLMVPGQLKLDVFEEAKRLCFEYPKTEFAVLQNSVAELKSKSKGASKAAICARVALLVMKTKSVRIVASDLNKADDAIVQWAHLELAKGKQVAVATNDEKLRKRLRKVGAPIICLKGRSRLDWY